MVFPFHHRRANQREKPPSQRLPSGSARNRNGGRAGPTSLPGLLTREGGRGGREAKPSRAKQTAGGRSGFRAVFAFLRRAIGTEAGPVIGTGAGISSSEQARGENRIERIHLRRNRPQLSQMGKFTPETDPPARANQRERGAARNKETEAGADFGKYFQRPRPEAGEQGAESRERGKFRNVFTSHRRNIGPEAGAVIGTGAGSAERADQERGLRGEGV